MTLWVASDHHFNHENIIQYCARPFASVTEMNEWMIEAWNSVVGKRDTVWVLGDFAYSNPRGLELDFIFDALAGTKILVAGNHDEKNPKVMRLPWAQLHHLATIRHEGRRAIACHYPLETWKNAQRGYIMLHGHSHGTLQRKLPRRYDVGVDAQGFAPVPIDHYFARSKGEPFTPADHHGGQS